MLIGRYDIIEIREDSEGQLWFLAKNYYEGESWWLHISDEYSNKHWNAEGPRGKKYELREVRSEGGTD